MCQPGSDFLSLDEEEQRWFKISKLGLCFLLISFCDNIFV